MNKENNAKKLSNDIFLIFILVFAWLFFGWPGVQEAQAAVAYDASSESHTGTTGSTSVASFTWTHTPVGAPKGILVFVFTFANADYITSVTYGGTAMTRVTGGQAIDTVGEPGRTDTFFLGASVPSGTQSVVVNRTNNATVMYATVMSVTAAANTTPVGIVLLQDDGAYAEQSVNDGSPGSNSVRFASGFSGGNSILTAGAASTVIQSIDFGAYTVTLARETTAGQGARNIGFTYATTDDRAAVHLAVSEITTTTLGDGTDPSNSTVAPGSTGNYLDQFTLITSAGTDSVTALTVTTANTSAIASMQIWNEAMTTQYFTTVSSPVVDAWNFSAGTAIPVTTSSASFRVVFTATSHASLAAGTYAVTGTVTSYTCTNSQTGTDTDSATITVDNSPPADATWGTITPGNTQIVLNWTNPGDADFNKVLILRNTVLITDAPTEGTEYVQNDPIGTSTVRYVGNLQTFTDTGLTNGTNYYYKIFAYDSYINYAAGVGTGPHTPVLTLSISVSPLTWGVGTVDAATAQMSTSGTKIGVTNDGNVTETFNLQIFDEDDRNEWTHASLKTGAGNNIYVLSGIFCATANSPTDGSFNEGDSEDVLTTTQQTATATKFAYTGGSANAVSVPVGEARSLWLRLDMPTAVSGTYPYDQHTITVRIGCQQ